MKKIYSIVMLVFVLTLQAQTQTFNSKLKLATVPEGTAHDSVLVRGEDQIVKYVKKGDLMSSSSAPAMLQGEGAPSGNSAVSDWWGNNLPRNMFYFDNSNYKLYTFDYGSSDWVTIGQQSLQKTTDTGNTTSNSITVNDNAIFVKHQDNANEERVVLEAGGINFIHDAMEYGGTLKLPSSTSTWQTWNLPNASGTLATTSDIANATTLQAITNNGNTTTRTIEMQGLKITGDEGMSMSDHSTGANTTILANNAAFRVFTPSKTFLEAYGDAFGWGDVMIKSSTLTGTRVYGLPDAGGTLAVVSKDPPSSSTAPGKYGEIRITPDYVYYCIGTNMWARAELTSW